jgi:hypothetical protein
MEPRFIAKEGLTKQAGAGAAAEQCDEPRGFRNRLERNANVELPMLLVETLSFRCFQANAPAVPSWPPSLHTKPARQDWLGGLTVTSSKLR